MLTVCRRLDGYLTERINRYMQKQVEEDYFLNLHRLDKNSLYQPGARKIWLSRVHPEKGAIIWIWTKQNCGRFLNSQKTFRC